MSSEESDQPVLFFQTDRCPRSSFRVPLELIDSLCELRRPRFESVVARPIYVFAACQVRHFYTSCHDPQCMSFVSQGKGNNSNRFQFDWIDVFPSLVFMIISGYLTPTKHCIIFLH